MKTAVAVCLMVVMSVNSIASAQTQEASTTQARSERDVLLAVATNSHRKADALRRTAEAERREARRLSGRPRAALEARSRNHAHRAEVEYSAAAQAYERLLPGASNEREAYELRYQHAGALFGMERYAEAAQAYEQVRDAEGITLHLAAAAYRVVQAREGFVRREAIEGRFDPCLAVRAGIDAAVLTDPRGRPLLAASTAEACTHPITDDPPAGRETAIDEVAIPVAVLAILVARFAYVNRVARAVDDEPALRDVVQINAEHPESNPPYQPAFAYLNARTLMRFGRVVVAESLYRRILEDYCDDQRITGAAFADLRSILVRQNREEYLDALTPDLRPGCGCARQIARLRAHLAAISQNAPFRHSMALFQAAERGAADQSTALYEHAAWSMDVAARLNRTHEHAAQATFYAALAYERSDRPDADVRAPPAGLRHHA